MIISNPINYSEEFQHLSKAPIVEAVIEIRNVFKTTWDDTVLKKELQSKLSDYSKIQDLRESKVSIKIPDNPIVEDLGCIGFKLQSNDNLHVAQFKKGAFVFSRLKPYENWGQFSQEGLRLWAIYSELLHPTDIRRIGVRFINRIAPQEGRLKFEDYYQSTPQPLQKLNWPLTGFLHRDVIGVPDTSYFVNLIKTIEHKGKETGLILDIDVFTQQSFEYDENKIKEKLKEMRWVKNKIFQNSITKQAIEELR